MRIKLNKEFYDKESVKEALKDFDGVCEGRILNDSFEVELEPREETEQLKDEFCNYVLGLMKNRTVV